MVQIVTFLNGDDTIALLFRRYVVAMVVVLYVEATCTHSTWGNVEKTCTHKP